MKVIQITTYLLECLTSQELQRLIDNLQLPKGGGEPMKKKKSPSKLKLATTAKAKKALKAKKK